MYTSAIPYVGPILRFLPCAFYHIHVLFTCMSQILRFFFDKKKKIMKLSSVFFFKSKHWWKYIYSNSLTIADHDILKHSNSLRSVSYYNGNLYTYYMYTHTYVSLRCAFINIINFW